MASEHRAFLKALGTGWRKGIRWTDVEIRNDGSGRPVAHLRGKAKEFANQMGAEQVFVSLSHDKEYAVASVLLEG